MELFLPLDPVEHHEFISLDLSLEFIESWEFLIISDLIEWCYTDHLTIDIIREVEKMCLKKLLILEKNSDTVIILTSNNTRKSIGPRWEVGTTTGERDIRCRETDRPSEFLSLDNNSWNHAPQKKI